MKAIHKHIFFIVIIMLLFIVTACSNNQDVVPPAEKVVDENRDPRIHELLNQFDSLVQPSVIPISVAMAELLHELNVIPAGVPMSSMTLPAAFDEIPRIGSTIQPDLEQIIKLQPDVVLIPESLKDSLGKKLETSGLKLAFLPVDSLDEMKITMEVFGVLFNKELAVDEFLSNFAEEEQKYVATYSEKEAPKVMFLFGSADSLMFMNENTFAGSLAHNLGAVNVVSDLLNVKETYAPLDMESIVQVNPDVILLIAHGDPEAVAKNFEEDVRNNGVWEKLNAFQNDKMQTLKYELFGSASLTKAIAAYKEMAEILYD